MSDDDSDDDFTGFINKKKAERLYKEAKKLGKESDYEMCLSKLKLALKLDPDNERFKERIEQIEEIIREESLEGTGQSSGELSVTSEEPFECDSKEKSSAGEVELAPKFSVERGIYEKLYDYQREGIKKLYQWFANKDGGILADDMGLGKTIQTLVLLSSLFKAKLISNVLIVAPVSLMQNWIVECEKWAENITIQRYHGSNRNYILEDVQRYGGVMITTYETARSNFEMLGRFKNKDFVWHYIILDEAHKIKNPTKTTRNLHLIPAKVRLAITGTPVQNNLRELWVLFDYVSQGTLFGSYQTFKMELEVPITESRKKGAHPQLMAVGKEKAKTLRSLYEPYFLRRTKGQVFGRMSLGGASPNIKLPSKTDWVVWIKLSETQVKIYNDFLDNPEIQEIILRADKKTIFVKLIAIKKMCDHPRLLSPNTWKELLDQSLCSDPEDDFKENQNILNLSDETLIKESGKLAFLIDLLKNLRNEGHRTLVFARSLKILDMIQRILFNLNDNWTVERIDGRVKIKDRDEIVKRFQSTNISVCLLTTQVGGVGLTLTGADRVVIYDPSWNPGNDSQAVDRVYRIGQKKPVIVYRLITCGGVEEKIYRRQVFKNSLINQTVDQNEDPLRYFNEQELKDLFKLDDPSVSKTYLQLKQMHGHQEKLSILDSNHRDMIKRFKNCYDISDNSLLFSYESSDSVELTPELNELAKNQSENTKQKIKNEGDAIKQYLKNSEVYTRPFTLTVSEKEKPPKEDKLEDDFTFLDESIKYNQNQSIILLDDSIKESEQNNITESILEDEISQNKEHETSLEVRENDVDGKSWNNFEKNLDYQVSRELESKCSIVKENCDELYSLDGNKQFDKQGNSTILLDETSQDDEEQTHIYESLSDDEVSKTLEREEASFGLSKKSFECHLSHGRSEMIKESEDFEEINQSKESIDVEKETENSRASFSNLILEDELLLQNENLEEQDLAINQIISDEKKEDETSFDETEITNNELSLQDESEKEAEQFSTEFQSEDDASNIISTISQLGKLYEDENELTENDEEDIDQTEIIESNENDEPLKYQQEVLAMPDEAIKINETSELRYSVGSEARKVNFSVGQLSPDPENNNSNSSTASSKDKSHRYRIAESDDSSEELEESSPYFSTNSNIGNFSDSFMSLKKSPWVSERKKKKFKSNLFDLDLSPVVCSGPMELDESIDELTQELEQSLVLDKDNSQHSLCGGDCEESMQLK